MGQKKEARLEDVARELGISIVSVSNALNDKKGVGEELRKKIKAKAEELGYELPKAQPKKEQKSYYIGVMIAERYVKEFPSFYMDIYKQMAQVAAKKGSVTFLEVVGNGKESMQDTSGFFFEMGVDGIVFVGEMKIEFIQAVRNAHKVPVIGIDFYDPDEKMDYIITDSYHGMQSVTQRLIDAGHKEIAFLGNPHGTRNIMDRYLGYCKALQINGIEERPEWVIPDRHDREQMARIEFELPEHLPTAFAVNCDKSAYLLIEKLKRKGIRVPEDVSVAGFDHSVPEGTEKVKLTTYENDEKVLAQIGLNMLLKKLESKNVSDKVEGIRIVEGKLIEGNTIREIQR